MNIQISVIVPIYNVQRFLASCLESILCQQDVEFEVICVNDGSTDDSQAVAETFARQDARVIIINQTNQGLSCARNTGISAARGEWICFVDSDDKIGWKGITTGHEFADMLSYADPSVDAVVGNAVYVDEDNNVISDHLTKHRHLGIFEPTPQTLPYINIETWNKLYRRSVITDNHILFPAGLRYEDENFFPKFFTLTRRFVLAPVPLYTYYRHEGTIMSKTVRNKNILNGRDYLRIIDSNLAFFNERKLTTKYLPYLQRHSYGLLQAAIEYSGQEDRQTLIDEFFCILSKHGLPVTGNDKLVSLARLDQFNKDSTHNSIGLNNAKHFNPELFHCVADRLKKIATAKPRTLRSRLLNLCINYYGQHILHRHVRRMKKIRKQDLSDTLQSKQCACNRKSVFEFLTDIRQEQTEPVYYVANPGNAGDAAIALGTFHLFDKVGIDYQILHWDNDNLPDLTGKTILFGGGGNLIENRYADLYKIIGRYVDSNRCIVLPHTIFGYKDLVQRVQDGNLIIFCREETSYSRCVMANDGNNQNIFLDDDLAFSIDEEFLRPFRETAGRGTANCFRTDSEALGLYSVPKDNHDISLSWNGPFWSDKKLTEAVVSTLLAYLSEYEFIRTDRLHVAILSTLIGRKVFLYPNAYYKNKAIFEMSLKQYPETYFINTATNKCYQEYMQSSSDKKAGTR